VTGASDTAEHVLLAHALDVLAHLQGDPERALEVTVAVDRTFRWNDRTWYKTTKTLITTRGWDTLVSIGWSG